MHSWRSPRTTLRTLLLTLSVSLVACGEEDGDDGDPRVEQPADAGTLEDARVPVDAASNEPDADGLDAAQGDAALSLDAEQDSTIDGSADDAALDADESDASQPDANEADANEPDAAPEVCATSCPFGVCAGASCAVTRLVENAGGPLDMVAVAGSVYWQEQKSLYRCSTFPCTNAGAAIASAIGNHTWWALASTQVQGTPYLFVTDNNYTLGISRIPTSGGTVSSWGNAFGNAGPIAAHGDMLVWGDGGSTYRSSASSSGATLIMHVGPSTVVPAANGPARRTVALDATTVFAASASDVFKCDIASTCLSNPERAASEAMPGVLAMTIQDGTLYALGGTPFSAQGKETLWSVPTGGGTRTLLAERTPGASTEHHSYVLLADAQALYWNSYDGNMYTCARSDCQPRVFIEGARATAMDQDAQYVYWASQSQHVIYRVLKP